MPDDDSPTIWKPSDRPRKGRRADLRRQLLSETGEWGDEYLGTKEELVAAGLLADGMFPGDPSRGKGSATYYGPHKMRVVRLGKGRFRLWIWTSDQEREQRSKREAAIREFDIARQNESRDLDGLPDSKKVFRDRALRYLRDTSKVPRELWRCLGCGYKFDRASLDALDDAIEEAIDDFAALAVVHYKPEEREAYVATIKARTAKADPRFASLMASIVAGAKESS